MIAPRILSVPPAVSSLGREAVELAASGGVVLDDWQAFTLDQSLGLRPDGKWAAFEAAVNVARQNGKNEIALARELAGLFLFGERLLIHSAHEFKTSTEHQRRLEEVVQDTPELHKRVKPRGYRHSHGEESIELRTGQRIRFMTRTKGGGRGHTGDLVVFDEAMILAAAMLGALMPTLSARSVTGNPQLFYFFTAVDQLLQEHGLVAAGLRARALAGGDPSLAYFEWSAGMPLLDGRERLPSELTLAMVADERMWEQGNPALDVRISREHVGNELRSMDLRTFAVERLGVGDYPAEIVAETVIALDAWWKLLDKRSKALDPVCFAFDVAPDRSWGAVSVAGYRRDGRRHLEVVEHKRGTGWIPARLAGLVERNENVGVICDTSGPAGSLVPALREAGFTVVAVAEEQPQGMTVVAVGAREHAQGCGMLVDGVDQGTLRHLGSSEFADALKGATKRPLGDAWAWSRRNSAADTTPLVSNTLALWGLATLRAPAGPMFAYV